MKTFSPDLIIPLDFSDVDSALAMAQLLAPEKPWMKIGLEMLMHAGPSFVTRISECGVPVFLDGKFHDIPNTVAGAVRNAVKTGAKMVNVHAFGGLRMMQAAVKAAEESANNAGIAKPLMIAVTVLTSISEEELRDEIGCNRSANQQAVALAQLAREAGMDGVVTSAHEISAIKEACGKEFLTVVPGIRLANNVADDQRRIATPASAIRAGADFLVVGRPVTEAANPLMVCQQIREEMKNAFN
jgi:orotidine-5'-phosphate decarboxylase